MRRFLLLFLFAGLFFARPARADPDVGAAEAMSRAWLAQIDTGNYAASYAEGGSAFRDKVTPEKWSMVLQTIRGPLGKVTSRKLISHDYKSTGFEGLEGEIMVLTYETTFADGGGYLERTVLRLEDGQWRGLLYHAAPEQQPGDSH
jgi:hypothetical protein